MREIIKYDSYIRAVKYVDKLGHAKTLDAVVTKLASSDALMAHDHPLHRTARHKSGLTGLRELHITGELLLIYRRVGAALELVDICKNHKDLAKRY